MTLSPGIGSVESTMTLYRRGGYIIPNFVHFPDPLPPVPASATTRKGKPGEEWSRGQRVLLDLDSERGGFVSPHSVSLTILPAGCRGQVLFNVGSLGRGSSSFSLSRTSNVGL